MKTSPTALVAALMGLLAITPVWADTGRSAAWHAGYQTVDTEEAATLTFMREEEKLARDLYRAMAEQWDAAIFTNIALSEQQHMDAVKRMLDKYSLADPAQADVAGWFSDPELQTLYSELSAQGLGSYLDALKAGALVEEVDIEDNENAVAATDNTDLATVYGNLLRGSRNHLRAFVGEIERLGVVYEAQYLDPAVVDEILDSPTERGNAGNPRSTGRRLGRQR